MSKKANFYSGKALVASVAAAALGVVALNTQEVKADQTTDQSVATAKLKQTANNIVPVANTTNDADDNLSKQIGSETNEKVQPPVNDNQPAQPKKTIKTVADSSTPIKWKDSKVTLTLTNDNQELDISGGTITDPQPLYEVLGNESFSIKKIKITDNLTITGKAPFLFSGLGALTQIEGLEKLNTSGVINMKNMFFGCFYLTSLDVSHFDTSNVTNMSGMFKACCNLTSLDVSHFDTSNVINMSSMFDGCSSSTLDVSHFDTSNVTSMSSMFDGCHNLTSLDVSHFDTSKVTDMSIMFEECTALNTLKLGSNFNRKNNTLGLSGSWHRVGSGTLNNPEEKTGQSGTRFDSSTVSADTYVRLGSVTVHYLDSSNKDLDSSNKEIEKETCRGLLGGEFSPKQEITDNNGQKYFLTTDSKNSQNVTFTDTNPDVYFYYTGVDAAHQAIKEEAQATKQKIQEDQSLTAKEKTQQTKAVDNAVTNANTQIDEATNADGVNTAVSTGKTNIKNAYNPGTGLEEQKSAAHQAIQEEAVKIKQKIQEDQSLTANEKTKQTTDVDNAVTNANTQIDEATNADGVNQAVSTGKTNIKNAYQPANIPNAGSSIQNVQGGDVTVHYQDEQGNTLAPDEILKGHLGEGYTSQAKKITGYSLKLRPEKATGFFENNPQSITYVYTLDQAKISKQLMHNAFIYDINHHRIGNSKFNSYENIMVYPKTVRLTDGVLAYKLADNQYVLAANIDGTLRQLKHNSYVYQTGSKRANYRLLRKGRYIRTYGAPYQFKNGKLYYRIGGPKKQYVKVRNFK